MAGGHRDKSPESSPILGSEASGTHTTKYTEQDRSIPDHSLDESSAIADHSRYAGTNEGFSKHGRDHGDEEETALLTPKSINGDRDHQFEGIPEVKAKMKYIMPALALGIFLSAADQSLVASAAGSIGSDLNDLKSTSWIATAYFLTLTTFQPLYGKLSDIFGRKSCLLFAYTAFGLGCLWCGLARSMKELIFARAFAGTGGAGMSTVVSILMSDIIPLRERGTWQGFANIIYAVGAAVGALMGGALADSIGWRWSFIGQAPLCLVAFICVFFVLHLPNTESGDWRTKLRRIDFLGALLLVSAISTLLVGLDRGSNWSWTATVTIACLVASILLSLAFVLVEHKIATEPFAPGRIIFEQSLLGAYLCNFFSMAGWFGLIFYIPIYYQASQGLDATKSGLGLTPAIVSSVVGSLLGGFIMQKTGRYKWLTVAGFGLTALSSIPVLLFSGPVTHSSVAISIAMFLFGLGEGSGITTSLIALISNAQPEDQALVTASSYLFRSLGSVLGLSVQAAVFQVVLRKTLMKNLADSPDAAEIARKVRESLTFIEELSPKLQAEVRGAYTVSVNATFSLMIVLVSGAMLAAFFIRDKKLHR